MVEQSEENRKEQLKKCSYPNLFKKGGELIKEISIDGKPLDFNFEENSLERTEFPKIVFVVEKKVIDFDTISNIWQEKYGFILESEYCDNDFDLFTRKAIAFWNPIFKPYDYPDNPPILCYVASGRLRKSSSF